MKLCCEPKYGDGATSAATFLQREQAYAGTCAALQLQLELAAGHQCARSGCRGNMYAVELEATWAVVRAGTEEIASVEKQRVIIVTGPILCLHRQCSMENL